MMKKAYIYGLFDKSGIRYIGKAVSPKARYSVHLSNVREVNHRTNWIKSLLKKNKKPLMIVLEESTSNIIADRERAWISYGRKVGWRLVNGTDGGEGCYGRIFSEETRQKLRLANLGKKHSIETLEKLRKSHLGPRPWMKGKKHSYKTRELISQAGRGRICSPETKAKRLQTRKIRGSCCIAVEQLKNNVVIAEFKSITEAELSTNVKHISDCCRGVRKKAGGFQWKLKND